jgi:MGT family glycosyltransferase
MSHVAFFNIPAVGHVYPTLAVVDELVRRGHRVTYASTERRAPIIEAQGARVVRYRSTRPDDTDRGVRPPERDGYLSQSLMAFQEELEVTLPQLEPAFRADPPDLVVFDRMAFAGRVFAAKLGLPTVQSWVVMVSGAPWSLGRLLAPSALADPGYEAYVTRLESFLAGEGVPMTAEEFLNPVPLRHLAYLPRAFQCEGEQFDDAYCFVGPCIRTHDPAAAWAPWRPPANGRPVVMVTLGTIYNRDEEFYRTCFRAFADSPWHVVIAVGERVEPDDLGPAPSNVEVRQLVPQLEVLRHAAVFVCHAGMGGIMEALGHGVPLVAVPQTLEQEANAARLVELGLGAHLPPAGLTAEALRDAVELVTKEPAVAERIEWMRGEIRAAGGTARAADIVESCLPRSQVR